MRQHVVTRLAYPFLTNQVLYESRVLLSHHWRLYLSTRRLSFSSSGMVHNSGSVRSSNPFLKSTTKGMSPPRWERLGVDGGGARVVVYGDWMPCLPLTRGRGGCFYKTTHPGEVGTRERALWSGLRPDQSGILGPYKGMVTRSLHVTSRVYKRVAW